MEGRKENDGGRFWEEEKQVVPRRKVREEISDGKRRNDERTDSGINGGKRTEEDNETLGNCEMIKR